MDIDQKIDQLAIEVLRFARSEILVNLRFFNRALARIEFLPAATTIATNGKQLFYDPIYVLREYQIDQKRISRTYLHVVLTSNKTSGLRNICFPSLGPSITSSVI